MATSRFYVPLFVSTMDDGRLTRAGDDAELLWYRVLQIAKRIETDGVLEHTLVMRHSPRGKRTIDSLVEVGLLRPVGEHQYQLAGWLDWNEPKERSEKRRAEDRQRKANSGRKPKDSNGNPDGIQDRSETIREGKLSEAEAVLSESGLTFADLFAAVLAACGWLEADMNAEARSRATDATVSLAVRGATPTNVPLRAAQWTGTHRLTPEALDRNWPALTVPEAPPVGATDTEGQYMVLARNRAERTDTTADEFEDELTSKGVPLGQHPVRVAAMAKFHEARNPPKPERHLKAAT